MTDYIHERTIVFLFSLDKIFMISRIEICMETLYSQHTHSVFPLIHLSLNITTIYILLWYVCCIAITKCLTRVWGGKRPCYLFSFLYPLEEFPKHFSLNIAAFLLIDWHLMKLMRSLQNIDVHGAISESILAFFGKYQILLIILYNYVRELYIKTKRTSF